MSAPPLKPLLVTERPLPPLFGINAPVCRTDRGTPYLQVPGVVMTNRTYSAPEAIRGFLEGFDSSLQFPAYLDDPTRLTDGTAAAKVAGQLCYYSFGPERTTNADAGSYFENILNERHGSVLEHTSYTFLFYGVSRSLTHELVRHRLAGYSQVSQRYVGGKTLRFVERPEFAKDPELHALFMDRIDAAAREYERLTKLLADRQGGMPEDRKARTAMRKAVRQAARSCLPNETEAPIFCTMNARSWRFFIEQRTSKHAEPEIRRVGAVVLACLRSADPLLFADYETSNLPDGSLVASTPNMKI